MMINEYDVLRQAVTLLDKKLALDMVALDVSELTVLSHYFVICSGGSTSQLHALSDELKEKMGHLDSGTMNHVNNAIQVSFGLGATTEE